MHFDMVFIFVREMIKKKGQNHLKLEHYLEFQLIN